MKTLEIKKLEYIYLTSFLPKEWDSWIWDKLFQHPHFSIGEINVSLIHPDNFRDIIENVFETSEEHIDQIKEYRGAIYDTINYLSKFKIHIDLEK